MTQGGGVPAVLRQDEVNKDEKGRGRGREGWTGGGREGKQMIA